MAFQEHVLVETLERLGITLWVKGQPFGKIKNGGLVGSPKCGNCAQSYVIGVTLDGRQNICRDCIDSLRGLLFELLKEKFPELIKPDRTAT